jgi:hypothetical protein
MNKFSLSPASDSDDDTVLLRFWIFIKTFAPDVEIDLLGFMLLEFNDETEILE